MTGLTDAELNAGAAAHGYRDETVRARVELLPTMPDQLREAIESGEPVWDSDQLRADFTVEGFLAPFVVVRRKSDGVRGSMMFAHSPRYYFRWRED